MKISKTIIGLATTLALGTLLVGCGTSKTSNSNGNDKINVVASIDFYGEAAEAVLGNHGTVTSIINKPDVDPHDYEPTSAVGKKVAKANVAIENGAGYDSWMSKLVKGSGNTIKTVSAAKVVGVEDGENEHIWYKPQTMPKMANALAKEFGKIDAKHKATYKENAKKYIDSLNPLLTLIDKLKANADGKKVAVSEPVFVNALNYLGYKVSDEHFAESVEESTDPTSADIKNLEDDIANNKIAFFVQNTQVQSKVVDNIVKKCEDAGIPILKVTETLPAGKTYTEWMTDQYTALEKIQDAENK